MTKFKNRWEIQKKWYNFSDNMTMALLIAHHIGKLPFNHKWELEEEIGYFNNIHWRGTKNNGSQQKKVLSIYELWDMNYLESTRQMSISIIWYQWSKQRYILKAISMSNA